MLRMKSFRKLRMINCFSVSEEGHPSGHTPDELVWRYGWNVGHCQTLFDFLTIRVQKLTVIAQEHQRELTNLRDYNDELLAVQQDAVRSVQNYSSINISIRDELNELGRRYDVPLDHNRQAISCMKLLCKDSWKAQKEASIQLRAAELRLQEAKAMYTEAKEEFRSATLGQL